jgi:hypothetical protein
MFKKMSKLVITEKNIFGFILNSNILLRRIFDTRRNYFAMFNFGYPSKS